MFKSIFITVSDPRVQGRTLYKLSDILTSALLTLVCNGVDYNDMEDFARYRAPSLGLFEGCTTTPSHDTFRRMLSIINPAEVAQCFIDSGRKNLHCRLRRIIQIRQV